MTRGTFWNPNSKADAYPGRLTSKKGTPWLQVEVHPDEFQQLAQNFGRAEVIHGRTGKGAPLTLWHTDPSSNFLLNEKSVGDDLLSHDQQFAYVIRGAHVERPGETLFRQSTVTFWDMAAWALHPTLVPFDQETPPAFASARIPNVYETGADVTVTIENAAYIEQLESGHDGYGRFLGEDARIVFTFEEGQTLKTHQQLAFDLRALVTFCYQRAATYREQTLSFEPGGAELFYSYRREEKRPKGRTHCSQLVLSPTELSPAILFPRWWSGIGDLYPLPQVLAGRYYTKRAYLEGHVLSAVASAEKLYSLLGLPKKRFESSFFKTRKSEHIQLEKDRGKIDTSAAQGEFEKVLTEVLKNEPTFDMKLRALVEYVGPDLMAAADIDTELWVMKVKQVRNKLAHEGSHVDEISDSGADWLGRVDDSTRVLLSLAVRDWLGAPQLEHKRLRRIFTGRSVRYEPGERPGDSTSDGSVD